MLLKKKKRFTVGLLKMPTPLAKLHLLPFLIGSETSLLAIMPVCRLIGLLVGRSVMISSFTCHAPIGALVSPLNPKISICLGFRHPAGGRDQAYQPGHPVRAQHPCLRPHGGKLGQRGRGGGALELGGRGLN